MDIQSIEHVAIHGSKSGLHGSHQQDLIRFVENCPHRYSPEAQGMTNPGEGIIFDLFIQHGWPMDTARDEIRKAMQPYYQRQKRKNRRA